VASVEAAMTDRTQRNRPSRRPVRKAVRHLPCNTRQPTRNQRKEDMP
jgi:hypothetical protein